MVYGVSSGDSIAWIRRRFRGLKGRGEGARRGRIFPGESLDRFGYSLSSFHCFVARSLAAPLPSGVVGRGE